MPFTSDDVLPQGYVRGTTAHDYAVLHDGEQIGTARVPGVAALVNGGQDVQQYIADRLNACEASEGFEKLVRSLSVVLEV
jgi:hypothetical protein